jgi:enamine deaminase RidA (YjgF/YER057c/UK114 family)
MTTPPPLKMIDVDTHAVSPGFDARISELGLTLPLPAAPIAGYVAAVEVRDMLYISGQLPWKGSLLMHGRLGEDRGIEFGQEAARNCAMMLIAQMKMALGSLDRVERIVKLTIFVNSDARFTDQPKVADGASNLMVEVFGDAGRHARSAVGVLALPLGAAVEVEAIVAIRSA